MSKELSQSEMSSRKSTPAVYQRQLYKREKKLRKEDFQHGLGFCWVF